MALKNPQRRLVELGHTLLGKRKKYDKETIEHVNGKKVIRQLYRCEAPSCLKWPHLRQFWRIRQEVTRKGETSVEERYFVSSLDFNKLNNAEILKAIRMHWAIENNGNWIFDTVWKEDDSPWCNKGFVFVTLLRILCYNIVSRLKTRRMRKKDVRGRSWKNILFIVYTVIIELKNSNESKWSIQTCKA